jgi:3-dehydroquinate dehydratase
MEQRPEFCSTLGGQIINFIYKNCQIPPPRGNQLVVPKINQEINERSYEMVSISMTNYGQNNRIFGIFFFVDFLFSSLTTPNVFIVMVLKCTY